MKFKKYIIPTLFSFFIILSSVNAAILTGDKTQKINSQVTNIAGKAGISTDATVTVGSILSKVVNGFLGFLGLIFIILLITAGYKWMNARGNEEKVTEATDTIQRAIIGLVITLSAYAITYFVFNKLDFFSGSGGATVTGS